LAILDMPLPGRFRTDRRRALGAELALLAFGLAAALLMAEVFFRAHDPLGQRLRGNRIVLPVGKHYVVEQRQASKLENVIVHTRNSLGFRGEDPPRDFDQHLTVVAVGGSTTECTYLSDGTDWPALVARGLKPSFPSLWMNNAGLNGHSTFGNLMLLRQHLLGLRPKVIVLMAGINDLARDDLSAYDAMQLAPPSTMEVLAQHSAAASATLNLWRAWKASRAGLLHSQIDLRSWPTAERRPDAMGLLNFHRRQFLPGYRQRILLLVRLCREASIAVVLVTQPTLYGPGIDDETGVDLGRIAVSPEEGVDGALAWEILELYNDVLRDTGNRESVPVIDLARLLPKSSRLFYDFMHFTPPGSERVAQIVTPPLCAYLGQGFPEYLAHPCPVASSAP
jgi:lysophospholipase L1-like esterase